MFEMSYRTPEIEAAGKDSTSLILVADLAKPHQLFQGQSVKVKTGVAIKSDQLVFACPLPELNQLGLVMGSGVELLETEGNEVEVLLWNRNQQGQQRMIEIQPNMPIAQLTVMPRYNVQGEGKAPAKKPGRKPSAAKEAAPKTGTDG